MSISYSNKVNERLIGSAISAEPHVIGIVGVDTVALGVIRLIEVPQAPSPLSTVSIPGYNEIFSGSPTGTQFIVNYTTGVITFNLLQDGNSVSVSYIGLGSEIAAEDINELQGPVGVALNLDGSLTSHTVKPLSISNLGTDNFSFPNNVIAAGSSTAVEFISATINPASAGQVRLAKTDSIDWRNNLNSADIALSKDTGDNLLWNGHIIATPSASSVLSIAGTSDEIIASSATGNITLSTPQAIATTSSPTFASLTLSTPLSIANGGTNSSTALAGSKIMRSSASAVVEGQVTADGSGNLGAITSLTSNTANPALSGVLRLAKTDSIKWRNNANGADIAISKDTSDVLSYAGNNFVTSVTGTSNEISVSTTGNGVTLSTPQAIATTSSPTFVSETLSSTTNQLVLGTTNTTTISSVAPSASRIYVIPDAGTTANFVLDKGNYTIGGTWSFSNSITLGSSKALILNDDDSSDTVSIQASNGTTTYSLNLPTAQGLANTVLRNDGTGNLSWTFINTPVATKTSNYPIVTGDKVILANAAITVTLPTAVGITGKSFIIKNITASSQVTVNTTSSQTIDGQLTQILNSRSSMEVLSDGNVWRII